MCDSHTVENACESMDHKRPSPIQQKSIQFDIGALEVGLTSTITIASRIFNALKLDVRTLFSTLIWNTQS